jgi:hypothetical protein
MSTEKIKLNQSTEKLNSEKLNSEELKDEELEAVAGGKTHPTQPVIINGVPNVFGHHF